MTGIFQKSRFATGFLIASLMFGGAAIAVNINNTPEGGYLLCANNKTRAVTYPGTLKCPSGTTAIEVPGRSAMQGPDQNADSPSPIPTKSSPSAAPSGDSRCTLNYLKSNPTQASLVVPNCSIQQLTQLQADLNTFSQQCSLLTPPASNDPKASEKADAYAKSIAECKSGISILTAVVNEIAKKVKA